MSLVSSTWSGFEGASAISNEDLRRSGTSTDLKPQFSRSRRFDWEIIVFESVHVTKDKK